MDPANPRDSLLTTVTAQFQRHCRQRPNQIFVHFVERGEVSQVLTYATLAEGAAQYARLFHQQGLAPGAVVLIMLNHCPDQYLAFLGALLAGVMPSFMPFPSAKQDPELFWRGHRTLVARVDCAALVTYADNRASLIANLGDPRFSVLVPQDRHGLPVAWHAVDAGPEDTALLQHTSGTTGLKKGGALSHRALLNQVAHYARALQMGDGASIVSWLPLYHDMGLIACFLMPLILGVPVVAIDAFEWIVRPGILFALIERFRATHVWMPTFAFQHLARHHATIAHHDLSSVQAFIDCSEPCRAETFTEFSQRFAGNGVRSSALQVCYAAAETTFAITQTPHRQAARVVRVDDEVLEASGVMVPAENGRALLSCGVPIEGVSLRILDDTGNPLPDGRVGEIAIAGDSLFSGYFRLPEETQERMVDGWYRSRDLGFPGSTAPSLLAAMRSPSVSLVSGRG